MSERENILSRIREALRAPAPVPGAHDHERGEVTEAEAAKTTPRWLPTVGATFDQQVELFRANSVDLKTDFRLVASRDEAFAQLKAIAAAEGWKKIAAHKGELTDAAVAALGLPVCKTDTGYDVHELEACDAGITECDALIAQTGSVLVTTRSAGGRALSILPPHHVVLAQRDQLLPDLPAAYELVKRKYADSYPSLLCLITGPSRTGDIERILVLGAHGPKKLTIFCV
jgi:L-lactate dehydrogenase complex protein LldG